MRVAVLLLMLLFEQFLVYCIDKPSSNTPWATCCYSVCPSVFFEEFILLIISCYWIDKPHSSQPARSVRPVATRFVDTFLKNYSSSNFLLLNWQTSLVLTRSVCLSISWKNYSSNNFLLLNWQTSLIATRPFRATCCCSVCRYFSEEVTPRATSSEKYSSLRRILLAGRRWGWVCRRQW